MRILHHDAVNFQYLGETRYATVIGFISPDTLICETFRRHENGFDAIVMGEDDTNLHNPTYVPTFFTPCGVHISSPSEDRNGDDPIRVYCRDPHDMTTVLDFDIQYRQYSACSALCLSACGHLIGDLKGGDHVIGLSYGSAPKVCEALGIKYQRAIISPTDDDLEIIKACGFDARTLWSSRCIFVN